MTLNRPDILNAIGAEMTEHLIEQMQIADGEPSTGCIVLTGAGRAFCSGGDVNNMGAGPAVERVLHRDWHLLEALLETEKPIIAMVNGPAVGLGATLAMSCDLTYMAEEARIGDTHVNLGVLAGDGAIIPMLLNAGPARTKDFVLRGKLISGKEAAQSGIVTRALPAGDLASTTYEIAREIASHPAYAVRATKILLNRHHRWAASELLEASLAFEFHSMQIPDYSEAVERFRARRSAQRSKR